MSHPLLPFERASPEAGRKFQGRPTTSASSQGCLAVDKTPVPRPS